MLFGTTANLKFNDRGLIPAIIQDHEDSKVLMYMYMTKEAVKRSRKSGELWIYNRKKKKTWNPSRGETFEVPPDWALPPSRKMSLFMRSPAICSTCGARMKFTKTAFETKVFLGLSRPTARLTGR